LAAKPVIDIMLEVSCLETLDAAAPRRHDKITVAFYLGCVK
jgi:GrpB-like predicted nucleotidyltransferase (UPF0157 family)